MPWRAADLYYTPEAQPAVGTADAVADMPTLPALLLVLLAHSAVAQPPRRPGPPERRAGPRGPVSIDSTRSLAGSPDSEPERPSRAEPAVRARPLGMQCGRSSERAAAECSWCMQAGRRAKGTGAAALRPNLQPDHRHQHQPVDCGRNRLHCRNDWHKRRADCKRQHSAEPAGAREQRIWRRHGHAVRAQLRPDTPSLTSEPLCLALSQDSTRICVAPVDRRRCVLGPACSFPARPQHSRHSQKRPPAFLLALADMHPERALLRRTAGGGGQTVTVTNGGTAPVLGQAVGSVPGVAAAAPEDAPVMGAAAGPASLPASGGAAGVPGEAAAGGAGVAAGGAALPPQAVSVLAAAERAKNRPLVRMPEATLLFPWFVCGRCGSARRESGLRIVACAAAHRLPADTQAGAPQRSHYRCHMQLVSNEQVPCCMC